MVSLTQLKQVLDAADCIYKAEQVQEVLNTVARSIQQDYADKNPLILCVMNGGLYFTAELMRRFSFALELDYLHVSRYHNSTTGGKLKWRILPEATLEGRNVLIVDDILDAGFTLQAIQKKCLELGAANIETAVLARKSRQQVVVPVEYCGLVLPDRYVFGCGMDYQGYFRNLNDIYALKAE